MAALSFAVLPSWIEQYSAFSAKETQRFFVSCVQDSEQESIEDAHYMENKLS